MKSMGSVRMEMEMNTRIHKKTNRRSNFMLLNAKEDTVGNVFTRSTMFSIASLIPTVTPTQIPNDMSIAVVQTILL